VSLFVGNQQRHLFHHILLALTNHHGTNFLAGKKLAVLNTGEVTLVSPWAEAGDYICRFNDNRSLPYALRRVESSKTSKKLDKKLVRFFTKNKIDAREKYVDYTKEGEIVWKKDVLNLDTLTNLWPQHGTSGYLGEATVLHKEGRQALSSNLDQDCNYQLNSELKGKLDLLSSNVLRKAKIASDEEVLLIQTDTSNVGHFQLIGECLHENNSIFDQDRKEDELVEELCPGWKTNFSSMRQQHIIALH